MRKCVLIDKWISLLRSRTCQLLLVWCLSLFLGLVLAQYADPSCFALMRLAASCRMSIVGLCASLLLPYLLTVYAVLIGRPWLMLWCCGCKGFAFAYIGMLIRNAFGSAGWLIQPLLQFHQILLFPVLLWFCLRHGSKAKPTFRRDFWICLAAITLTAGFTYFVVSPFLAGLID